MEHRNPYYDLDESGLICNHGRTRAQIKRDEKLTGAYIRAEKAGKVFMLLKKQSKRLSKAK